MIISVPFLTQERHFAQFDWSPRLLVWSMHVEGLSCFTCFSIFPVIRGAAGGRVCVTCWEAGTGCTTGAWADELVRSAATLLVVSDAPSELCMLR